jgi:four helix bundle protein
MKYERFEDLPVWKAAVGLAARMFDWTKHDVFRGKGDLANQLQRAALSVSNNVAEGFERGSTKELIQFIYIARGSAGEVRSMLCVVEKLLELSTPSEISNFKSQISDFKSEISDLKSQAESISRQLRGWANSLQNSDIEGQRSASKARRLSNRTASKTRIAAAGGRRERLRTETFDTH